MDFERSMESGILQVSPSRVRVIADSSTHSFGRILSNWTMATDENEIDFSAALLRLAFDSNLVKRLHIG